ncbi:MAG: chorismate mutase [Actinomycetota bacterium]
MSDEQRLWAVRGAIKAESNDVGAILGATEELMRELMARNALEPERMVSCLFTTTDDLNAEFPAVAARRLGLEAVPLLCTRELDVPGAMRSVIRVLVHYYGPRDHAPAHTYLGQAQELRSDLGAAQ